MKLGVFAVYDRAAEAFMQPFYAQTIGSAIRSFTDAVNGDGGIAKHPEDYMLSQLGEFDDNSGELTSILPPKKLVTALEVKESSNA